MSRAPASNPRNPTAAPALWGATLPIPAGPGTGDDFEARVEAAWRHLKAAYFAVEEHGRLQDELGKLIAKEGNSEHQ